MAGGRKTAVVIGNGPVGHRFCEKLVEFDGGRDYRIVAFCEEPRPAYDRVRLTSYFDHRDPAKLAIARIEWYRENGIQLHVGDRARRIDRSRRRVVSEAGLDIPYDCVVLATGSRPFVPPIKGIDKRGVFVYRTIEDLDAIIDYSKKARSCAVIGGGLLGLEAAKAAYDLGLETHVVEFAPRLMPRQIDEAGSNLLVRQIEALGVRVHLQKATQGVLGNGRVTGMEFSDGGGLGVDMIIVSAGIRPRDELARDCGLDVGPRGGIAVDDQLRSTDPDIYAIGEAALHGGTIYGLIGPGWEMADVAAGHLAGRDVRFDGANLSTKLKLMGVDVASFGDYEAPAESAVPLVVDDPFAGIYKKLLFSTDGKRLVGGVLVGDASGYSELSTLAESDQDLPFEPAQLAGLGGEGAPDISVGIGDDAQVCFCNNVTKGAICSAIREHELATIGAVKECTTAGTGCGGCLPMVTGLLNAELEAAGKAVQKSLCEHFDYTRQDLFEIVKVKGIRTFEELIRDHGRGFGCETCKPAVTSILASLWNESITDPSHHTLQDTNDRFLANMQRGGLYSIVPRVPGGEITPAKLIALGTVARKYGLYTKITGGQRVDLFGAQVHQLPSIWEELIEAGFESGHAYGKALRTIKSCVGTTWCRYGVQDSVGFAVRIEKRYRGIRAPHKVKGAVSGCVRECAEAQSKDIGLVATETGYNLFVCGNGGAKPRHGDLLASSLDEDTAIRYIDRFFMYYIMTADKLTRTSVWIEQLEGGIERIKDVVVRDKLGVCDELERRMQFLVDSYRCEWKEVVNDPERRKLFRQFVNTDEVDSGIEIVPERGQARPADWPKDGVRLEQIKLPGGQKLGESRAAGGTQPGRKLEWVRIGRVADFPRNGGAAVKVGETQIAVFNLTDRGQWRACQNMCPHKNAFVLARGIAGSAGLSPKVTCPLHKKPFSLDTGECLSGEPYALKVFPVRVAGDGVYLLLPPELQLDALLATPLHVIQAGDAAAAQACAACT
ncbi:MAG: nitrite reductase large subunit NirB [Bryobacterales bacterium]|nr:nitrite reductase large subunit NirB [Bryobacterales bacterium]